MVLSFVAGLWETLLQRHPLLVYVTTWTMLTTATVAVASLSPEIAFAWAVSVPTSFFGACGPSYVRLPLDGPAGEVVCLPALYFERSRLDLIVPPVFAAVVVAASVCFVRSIGLWESDDDTER